MSVIIFLVKFENKMILSHCLRLKRRVVVIIERFLRRKRVAIISSEQPRLDVVEENNNTSTREIKDKDVKPMVAKPRKQLHVRLNPCERDVNEHDGDDDGGSHDVDSEIVDFLRSLTFESLKPKKGNSRHPPFDWRNIVEDGDNELHNELDLGRVVDDHLYDTILRQDLETGMNDYDHHNYRSRHIKVINSGSCKEDEVN
jgi:hypothetical protein